MAQPAGDKAMTEMASPAPPSSIWGVAPLPSPPGSTGSSASATGPSTQRSRPSLSRQSVTPVLRFWKAFDLDSKRVQLDSQGSTMKNEKEASVRSRKKLAESTKHFRRLGSDADKAAAAAPLLRSYQEEIDHLTRRAKFSENAFFQLYKGLYAAPDPAPALAVSAQASAGDELAEENKKLRRELRDFEAEFASLKNQDITIRSLEEQVAAAAREQDDAVQEQVERRTRELEHQLEEVRLEWAQQRRDYERQLDASRAELREAFARLDAMQSDLFAHKQRSGMARSALDVEMEAISQDSVALQTLQLENAQLKRRLDELLSSVGSVDGAGDSGDASTAATSGSEGDTMTRTLQAEQDAVVMTLRQEVVRLKEAQASASATAAREATRLAHELQRAQDAQEELTRQLQARPTVATFREVTRQLRVLQQLEYNLVDDEEAQLHEDDVTSASEVEAATVEVEQLLVARVRRLEHALQTVERSLAERSQALKQAQEVLQTRDAQLHDQAALVRKLEETVASLEKTKVRREAGRDAGMSSGDMGSDILLDAVGDQLGASAAASGSPASRDSAVGATAASSDSKMLEIVRGQRDRFRERMKELQADKTRVEEQAQSYKSTAARLETDNMQLYHKIRYLQSYGTGAGPLSRVAPGRHGAQSLEDGGGALADVEARYRGMYEEKMNPFVQFNKMEKQQRFTNLNAVDKILLTSARLLLGHRVTRSMAFGYILLLHLLVVATLYSFMHGCGISNDVSA